jgi:hypothetical protein
MMSRQFRHWPAVLACLAALSSFPAESWAEDAPELDGVDLMCVSALGGGYPGRGGLLLTARLRRIPEVPLALEVGFYAPWGVGANLLLDIYRNDRLRVHFFDPGVFYAWDPELRIVRPDVERDYDITMGLGVEWQFRDRWWLTVDHRFYFPDPFRTIGHYGDFARRIYTQSVIGVQTWVGVGYSF